MALMIRNLEEYFMEDQEFYLDKISYNRIDKSENINEYLLTCSDDIGVQLNQDFIKLTVQRSLNFEPKEIFELSISFGVILKFNEKKKQEIKWEDINLNEEFRENGQFVLSNIMNRISLLISEITSSFGQVPIVLPPKIASER